MKRITNIFFISFLLFLINCKGYSEDIIPYVMTGDFVMDDSSENYSICGVDFYLLNKSDKEIKNINHVKNPGSDKSKKFLDLIKK